MARSVLLVSDQLAGRFPERCVLSGAATDRAVREMAVSWTHTRWLLGVPGLVLLLAARGRPHRCRVALPVAASVWRRWHRRDLASLSALAAGLGGVTAGVVRADGGIAVLGGIGVLAAAAYRIRAAHRFWVTCILNSAHGTIIVEPTHGDFDIEARRLFERSLRGR